MAEILEFGYGTNAYCVELARSLIAFDLNVNSYAMLNLGRRRRLISITLCTPSRSID